MDIRPIKTEEDYRDALQQIDELMDAEPNSVEEARLDVLATLVEAYEMRHYPIPPPDPIAALEFYMEMRGLTRKDLEPSIGSRGRVTEILNRRRALTLPMIRNLSRNLGVPAQTLIPTYPLATEGRRRTARSLSLEGHRGGPVTVKSPPLPPNAVRESRERGVGG